MKIKNIIPFIGLVTALVSCDKLNTAPEGGVVVEDQITEEQLGVQVIGMYQELNGALNTFGDDDHTDYGIPAMHLRLDSDGMDLVSNYSGYNHFSSSLTYTNRLYTSSGTLFIWYRNYKIIRAANYILSKIDEGTKNPLMQSYIAEAKSLRAYAYMNLAQCYQFTYKGNEDKPCVPILTEKMSFNDGNNNPRKSVKEVYDLIISDLDDAIVKFEATKGEVARRDKMTVNVDVAHGLRARARLIMHNYAGAQEDAEAVLAKYSPYTRAEVAQPTFVSVNEHSWVWGLIYNENSTSVKTGIVNWPSQLCSLVSNGYTTGGATYRCINSNLFNQISPSDVRYGWWLDATGYSPNIANNEEYTEFVAEKNMDKYATMKFAPADYKVTSTYNTQDYPMMRAEEMELIRIECMAHQSLTSAKQELREFVTKYRDDSFETYAQTLEDFINEVWLQRRIELWGEGFAFFDIMRLHKDIDRRNSNFGTDYQWFIAADSPILLFRIPQSEIRANLLINDEDNNPEAPLPSI